MLRLLLLSAAFLLLGASSCAGTNVESAAGEPQSVREHLSGSDGIVDSKSDSLYGIDYHFDDGPRPFDDQADGWSDLYDVLEAAKLSGKHALVVMGANWCHDSRGLAHYLEDADLRAENITPFYELVYIDVGEKDRNIDIARHFGLDSVKGTPTVFVVTAEGEVLNLETAPTWRNAASRSENEMSTYFRDFASR